LGESSEKVKMVPLGENFGRAISSAEEQLLLDACGKSRSRSLLPLVVCWPLKAEQDSTRSALYSGTTSTLPSVLCASEKTRPRQVLARRAAQPARGGDPDLLGQQIPESQAFGLRGFALSFTGLFGEEGYLNGRSRPYKVDLQNR
jgi:hypothetical protein